MRTLLFVYFALVILTLSACQKSGREAVGPNQNGQCMANPASCNTSAYQEAQSHGFSPYGAGNYGQIHSYGSGTGSGYGYNQNNSAYLCNCPTGSMPTYNGHNGLGCVNRGMSGFSGYLYLSWGGSQWSSAPYLNSYAGGCYSGAVQSCTAGLQNNCPSGYFCKTTAPTSSLGLCVSTYR